MGNQKRYSRKMNAWLKHRMRNMNYITTGDVRGIHEGFIKMFPQMDKTFSELDAHMRVLKTKYRIPVKIQLTVWKERVPRKKDIGMGGRLMIPTATPLDMISNMLNKISELVCEMHNKLLVAEEQLTKLEDVKAVMDLYNQK